MTELCCRDLRVRRPDGFELRVPELGVESGAIVAVQGPNGSGKSTLLQACAGLLGLDGGRVEVDGRAHEGDAPAAVAHRRQVVLVHQEPYLFRGTVRRNLSWAQRLRGVPRAERRARNEAALASLGLEGFSERSGEQLSGGQRTLVALARALVLQPAVLLLDEVTRDLDTDHRCAVARAVRELASGGSAVLLATHDREMAESVADRRVRLENGELVS